jgi:hypothetical protein
MVVLHMILEIIWMAMAAIEALTDGAVGGW